MGKSGDLDGELYPIPIPTFPLKGKEGTGRKLPEGLLRQILHPTLLSYAFDKPGSCR